MTGNAHLPVPRSAAAPVAMDGSAIAPFTGSVAPVHDPGQLAFATQFVGREQAWSLLGANLRDRIESRMGALTEWWSQQVGGRSNAVVLGDRALIVCQPTLNDSGAPAHQLRTFPLGGRETFRTAAVSERTPGTAGRVAARIEPGRPVPAAASALSGRLDSRMSGFLGYLPARAQALLQEPFAGDHGRLWFDHYYIRTYETGSSGPIELTVWAYLASTAAITFLAGAAHGPADLTGPLSWKLTCWHAPVVRDGPRRH